MRHLWRLAGASALALLVFAMPAAAVPDQGKRANEDTAASGKSTKHDFRSPMQEKQDALLQQALVAKLNGKAKGKVHEVAKGQYVELEREGTDKIFTIIVEFGDTPYPHPLFSGPAPDGTPTRYDGPSHNEIPEPDRTKDNSTLWQPDYDTAHYENMYFERMREYYERQSSGRYSIEGAVHGWVEVPYNQALYGRDWCGGIVCSTSKMLSRDAMAVWVKQQLDAGQTIAQIADYLRGFDVWDRYDLDGDGNFDEPDGFIDHMQVVHAGGDQAAGDPIYGSDAIWSHRWYSNLQAGGPGGITGFNIGTNTGLLTSTLVPNNPTGVWVGDYTVQPENGGLGVFAHEYAHDLGLPDLYDTSGNTGGAENSTAFWTLMSSGANIGDGGPDGIGDAPTDLSAWELFQLGWLDPQGGSGPFYDVAFAGQKSEHKLGPNDAATKQAQALFVVLPDSERESVVTPPKTGSWAYWSGQGHNFTHTMTKVVTYAAGATLTADAWWETEAHFDYWFLEVSHDDGATWEPVTTNESLPASDDQGSFNTSGTGIAGSSGGVYLPLTANLPGSGTALVRFKYMTDANTGGRGVVLDNIAITGGAVDGGETAADRDAWEYDGFLAMENGVGITKHFNAYVAENRQYDGYDTSLKTAYNFGFLDSLETADLVEHYPYQDGLLIWYWNEAYGDNNVGDHPGKGLLLPVDAHPSFHHTYDGHLMRPRLLSYDSTFGFEPTDAITVHKNSQPSSIPSQPAAPVFDDRNDYWFASDGDGGTPGHVGRYQPGWNSVQVPKTGTQIRVKSVSGQGKLMQVEVRPAK
jgi:immune inhibitor A